MDEAALIAAGRAGDEDAFAELYRRHAQYVRAVGHSILRRDDVDDFCQDTFLLAFTRLSSFQGGCRFRTWITRIAVNQCLLQLRAARQPSRGDSHLLQISSLSEDDLHTRDHDLDRVGPRLDMDRMLRVLKPMTRRVFELAYVDGVPDVEIANMLGISLDSVKGRIYRAKQRIRQIHKDG